MTPENSRCFSWWPGLALVLLGLGLYLPALWTLPLIRGESMYALIPQEMYTSGQWLTPTLNGARYLDKAPLVYWCNLLAYHLFGVSDRVARLPTLLFALGEVWFTYLIGRRLLGPRPAWLGSFALLTSVGFFVLHHQILADHLVTLSLLAAVYVLLCWEEETNWRGAVCFQGALALGFMSKGFIALAFPLLILAGYAWLRRRPGLLSLALDPRGWLVFLTLAVPWFWAMEQAHPGFLRHHVVNEQILRFLGKRHPPDIIPFPLHEFWIFLFVWLLPWSLLLPEGIYRFWRAGNAPGTHIRPARDLLLLWTGVILGFFSLSGSPIEYYSLPVFPALALVMGWRLARYLETPRDRSLPLAFLFLGILGLGTFFLIPPLEDMFASNRRELVGMTGLIGSIAWEVTLGVPLGAFLGLAAGWRRPVLGVAVYGGLAVMLLFFTWKTFLTISPLLSDRIPGDYIRREARPGDLVVMEAIEEFEYGASLVFYSGHRLLMVERRGLPQFPYPVGPQENYIISPTRLLELWREPARVFLLVDKTFPPEPYVLKGQVVLDLPGKRLFVNHPLDASSRAGGSR